jgi:hypothetical protein
MNKIILTFLMFATFLSLSAKEPPVGTSTVIGGVLVDLYGSYWIYDEPLRGNLPIRVAVEYEKNGKTEMYVYQFETDAEGYFKIEHAPDGKYILKAIEMHIGQSTHITAASEYGRWAKGELYRYWGLLSGMMYRNEKDLVETFFEGETKSGIIDLGITHLTIKIDERMGGSGMKKYSPNSTAPWQRMSLIQGVNKVVDLSVKDFQTESNLLEMPMQEKENPVTMRAPRDYFNLE